MSNLIGYLEPEKVYEFCGKSGSGKSLLCYNVTASAIIDQTDHQVLWIETNLDYDPAVMRTKLGGLGYGQRQIDEMLERIVLKNINNFEQLIQLLRQVTVSSTMGNIKLIIFNTFNSIWRNFDVSHKQLRGTINNH